ncbi:hypothetical protein LCGC14_0146400 [marine sediment metagenome]|uniref:Uncharacterized protein n=1 Tax=marine sediment metagenome TaxID=412755 RepID=A0A0F9V3G6_9ZZZZ
MNGFKPTPDDLDISPPSLKDINRFAAAMDERTINLIMQLTALGCEVNRIGNEYSIKIPEDPITKKQILDLINMYP